MFRMTCGKRVTRLNKFIGRAMKYALFIFCVIVLVWVALVNPYVAVVASIIGGFFIKTLIDEELSFMAKRLNRVDKYDYIKCKKSRD